MPDCGKNLNARERKVVQERQKCERKGPWGIPGYSLGRGFEGKENRTKFVTDWKGRNELRKKKWSGKEATRNCWGGECTCGGPKRRRRKGNSAEASKSLRTSEKNQGHLMQEAFEWGCARILGSASGKKKKSCAYQKKKGVPTGKLDTKSS